MYKHCKSSKIFSLLYREKPSPIQRSYIASIQSPIVMSACGVHQSFPEFSTALFPSPNQKRSLHSSRSLLSSDSTSSSFYVPPFQRNPHYSYLTIDHKNNMKKLVSDPQTQYLENDSDILSFCTDWSSKYRSVPLQKASTSPPQQNSNTNAQSSSKPIVLFPKTTQEVSDILKYCNTHKLAVSPQAGNTGIVGGSIPMYDELVLNVSKMDNVLDFNPTTGVLTCEAGCIHTNLNEFLKKQSPQYSLPYDLGSSGSCRIGGNVSTNTGGLRMIKYGSLNKNILGLEVVLPDGRILNAMSGMKKDNTGMKLYQLFLGAEGTLGVVTKVCIQCMSVPSSVHTCVLSCDSFEKVLTVVGRFKEQMYDIAAGIEFYDELCLQLVLHSLPNAQDVFGRSKEEVMKGFLSVPDYETTTHTYYMLLETYGNDDQADSNRFSQFIETLFNDQLITDGVISQNNTQTQNMWTLRDQVATALSHVGPSTFFDLSLPLNSKSYEQLVHNSRKALGKSGESFVMGLGHLGDGNLHIATLFMNPNTVNETLEKFKQLIFTKTHELGGSISSEHGMGVEKSDYMHMFKNKDYMKTLESIKKQFDPNMIMNPYIFYV